MSVPTLTPRAAREQKVFRTLLDAMARPGSLGRLEIEAADPLVAVAEALVDHEVSFALAPERPELADTILRQTGSRVSSLETAEYVFCEPETLARVLSSAADGTWEYPDAGATVVCLVPAIGAGADDAEPLVLSGPGIRDEATVQIEGFSPEARRAFAERNAARPMGIDLIFVTAEGSVVCLNRYTRLEE